MNIDKSRKSQDMFKAKMIASGLSLFFVVLGMLTMYSHYMYANTKPINFSVDKIDLYIGFIQICLGLLPLTIYFKTTKFRYAWAMTLIVLSSASLCIILANMHY